MAVDTHVCRARRGERETRRIGRAIAALAGRQYGVVARSQLVELGAGADQVDRWIAMRRLIAVHRGVFAVGHRRLAVEGRWLAGVLAGGPHAALSDRSAADHWGLTELRRPTAHVTVPTHRRSRPGLRFHLRDLPEDEVTVHEGIPVTTVARTIFDLAATESPARVRQALAVAEERALGDETSVADLLDRYMGRRGAGRLRRELERAASEVGLARRELELRFAEFLDELKLPPPERNAPLRVGGRTYVADCIWRDRGLVAELDSRRHHAGWEAAEADRARDAALLAVGLRTLRVTWRRLHGDPAGLAADLLAALEVHVRRA